MKQSSGASDIESSASVIDIITTLGGKSYLPDNQLDSYVEEVTQAVSQEFSKLGLGANEAKVLSCLVVRGTLSATEISRNTGITRVMVYPYLTKLMNMGSIFSEFGRPQRYFSLPYGQLIDILVNSRTEILKQALSNREKYLRMISTVHNNFAMPSKGADSYQVLRGDNSVISRLHIMLPRATHKVIAVVSEGALARLSREGILADLASLTTEGISVQIKTTSRNASYYLEADEDRKFSLLYEILDQEMPLSYISVDDKEILLLLEDRDKGKEIDALYTTSAAMVKVFGLLYGKLLSK